MMEFLLTGRKVNEQNNSSEDDSFSFDGYQIVHGEYFSRNRTLALTFSLNSFSVSNTCLRKLWDIEYIQVLVNAEEKKLVIRASKEDEKDSFQWCDKKRKPKTILCRVFWAKISNLLGWNSDYKYRLFGNYIENDTERLLVFDLTKAQKYPSQKKNYDTKGVSYYPSFSDESVTQFGLPVEEHNKQLQINTFNGYTVFEIKDSNGLPDAETSDDSRERSNA